MNTIRIPVELGPRSHEIVIEGGATDAAAGHLAPFVRDGRLVVVSDLNVIAAQGDRLLAALARGGIRSEFVIVPPGEASKSWAALARLTERLAALRVERGDTVLAFGGGVIGDLAGFAASIYRRGIGVVQMPTSLLAMVDGAIGGKTGINLPSGKNLCGSFHQPGMILIDPSLLATLPARQLGAGHAEMAKYGLIGDAEFFGWCERNFDKLRLNDAAIWFEAIAVCARAKAAIVAADERDTRGTRALLNLGHTFAHALEAATGFSDQLLHGEAVAIGLALAFRFSSALGLCEPDEAARVERYLRRTGLPVRPGDIGIAISGHALVEHMRADKKVEGGSLTLVLARAIGQAFVSRDVDPEQLATFLDRLPDA